MRLICLVFVVNRLFYDRDPILTILLCKYATYKFLRWRFLKTNGVPLKINSGPNVLAGQNKNIKKKSIPSVLLTHTEHGIALPIHPNHGTYFRQEILSSWQSPLPKSQKKMSTFATALGGGIIRHRAA